MLASNRKAFSGVDTSWPVISRRERLCIRSKQERLVPESRGFHAGAA